MRVWPEEISQSMQENKGAPGSTFCFLENLMDSFSNSYSDSFTFLSRGKNLVNFTKLQLFSFCISWYSSNVVENFFLSSKEFIKAWQIKCNIASSTLLCPFIQYSESLDPVNYSISCLSFLSISIFWHIKHKPSQYTWEHGINRFLLP